MHPQCGVGQIRKSYYNVENYNDDLGTAGYQPECLITGKLQNMHEYSVVYVGFPIWWHTAPTIINTFLETYDFKGKTVIPFATSGGSSIKKACADLEAAYPEINWKEGKKHSERKYKSLCCHYRFGIFKRKREKKIMVMLMLPKEQWV